MHGALGAESSVDLLRSRVVWGGLELDFIGELLDLDVELVANGPQLVDVDTEHHLGGSVGA